MREIGQFPLVFVSVCVCVSSCFAGLGSFLSRGVASRHVATKCTEPSRARLIDTFFNISLTRRPASRWANLKVAASAQNLCVSHFQLCGAGGLTFAPRHIPKRVRGISPRALKPRPLPTRGDRALASESAAAAQHSACLMSGNLSSFVCQRRRGRPEDQDQCSISWRTSPAEHSPKLAISSIASRIRLSRPLKRQKHLT